mgnify:CR=1 FL=1
METRSRCSWCVGDQLYENYHDQEWGIPIYDDPTLFEFLILETFQAGLSWITILRKTENFRVAFDQFDFSKIAKYGIEHVEKLMLNKGIIRNKLKINAAVSNANAYLKIQAEFGSFSACYWKYTNGVTLQKSSHDFKKTPSNTPLSEEISKDLKCRGFKFVGPTVVYAFMQATGMVNDHETSCFRYNLTN